MKLRSIVNTTNIEIFTEEYTSKTTICTKNGQVVPNGNPRVFERAKIFYICSEVKIGSHVCSLLFKLSDPSYVSLRESFIERIKKLFFRVTTISSLNRLIEKLKLPKHQIHIVFGPVSKRLSVENVHLQEFFRININGSYTSLTYRYDDYEFYLKLSKFKSPTDMFNDKISGVSTTDKLYNIIKCYGNLQGLDIKNIFDSNKQLSISKFIEYCEENNEKYTQGYLLLPKQVDYLQKILFNKKLHGFKYTNALNRKMDSLVKLYK